MDIPTILITYGILFLGELGDKTQLIVFNLALEFKKFYKVGIGVTFGFALIVTIGVFFGAVITQFVPLFIISIASGIVFIIIGLLEARNLKELYLEKYKNVNDTKNSSLIDDLSENPNPNGKILISIEDYLDQITCSDITKPCSGCGRTAWLERPEEVGGGFYCSFCHPHLTRGIDLG